MKQMFFGAISCVCGSVACGMDVGNGWQPGRVVFLMGVIRMSEHHAWRVIFFSVAWGFLWGVPGAARGELRENPDANTRWIEDGVQIAVGKGSSDKHWMSGETALLVSSAPSADGGFILESPRRDQHVSGRYLPFDPAYPYLVWEISSVKYLADYHMFSMQILAGGPLSRAIQNIPTGIHTQNITYVMANAERRFLRFDLDGAKLALKYIKLVRQPDRFITIESPAFANKKSAGLGDEITVRVTLSEPAEDVSVRFYDTYLMVDLSVNGKNLLQLQSEDAGQKVWSAKFTLESIQGSTEKHRKSYPPGALYLKAVLLGSSIKTPLWTSNPVEIRHASSP